MKFLRQVFTTFKNMHLSKEEYDHVKSEIRYSNYKGINLICVAVAVIFFVVFILNSISYPLFNLYQIAFLVAFISSLILLLVNILFVRKHQQFSLGLAYFLLGCLYAYGIYVGVFANPNQVSVTFCVFIFIGPLLFIDRYWRIDIFSVLAICVFCILTYNNKVSDLYVVDIFNSIVFGTIGILFNRYYNYIKIRDFIILHQTIVENDFDPLVGVFNQTALIREIKKNLLISNNSGILLFVDLHNIGKVNDKYGMDSGDDILKQVGEELRSIFRNTDVIGRYNGDHFLIYMPNLGNLDIAKMRSKMVLVNLNEKIKVPEDYIKISACVGVAYCSEYGETFKSLLKKSQCALNIAKSKGENQISVYTENNK